MHYHARGLVKIYVSAGESLTLRLTATDDVEARVRAKLFERVLFQTHRRNNQPAQLHVTLALATRAAAFLAPPMRLRSSNVRAGA